MQETLPSYRRYNQATPHFRPIQISSATDVQHRQYGFAGTFAS